nr:hypothetical protein [Tanacetum cinerariifolium]
MRRHFLDEMTLVQDHGKPDLFLTMTCNKKWPEIENELLDGQTASDRPDLVARVFRAKLEVLKNLLFKKNILGRVAAYVYIVEFQKRGLPHAYFFIIMEPQCDVAELWFLLANMNPVVVPLQVHLPNQQQVRFADDADLTRIIERERDKRSMLTAFLSKDVYDEIIRYVNNNDSGHEVKNEYPIFVDEEHLRARYCLNVDQKDAYDEIIRYVNNNDSGVFFIDGPGGTGKTYLYNALLAEVRSCGSVALATASSGAAANNFPGGRTTH